MDLPGPGEGTLRSLSLLMSKVKKCSNDLGTDCCAMVYFFVCFFVGRFRLVRGSRSLSNSRPRARPSSGVDRFDVSLN